jgi:hypothetical protein
MPLPPNARDSTSPFPCDHFFSWLDEMGHSTQRLGALGAVAQATESLG